MMPALLKKFYTNPARTAAFLALQARVFPGLDLGWALAHSQLAAHTIPYGLFQNGQALSILNATPMTVLFGSQKYRALQIGTVATHPHWRGQGLSRRLLQEVLADFQAQVDLFFLFANRHVLDFYPRFGFSTVAEHSFAMACLGKKPFLRRLNLAAAQDQELLREYLQRAAPVSARFGIESYSFLSYFVLNKFMADFVWLDEDADLILVAAAEPDKLVVYDVIGPNLPADYFQRLGWPGVYRLETRFTPDHFHGDFLVTPFHDDDDQLFVHLPRQNVELTAALTGAFRVPTLAKT